MNNLISFIIVTYNSGSSIKECLKSIERFCDLKHEIIIVDNCSSDNTLDQIKKSTVKVKLLVQKVNLGFSKANNLAVAESTGDLLFFLNPDTELLTKIDPLIDRLNEDKNIGIIAPRLIDNKDNTQPSVRRLPTLIGALKEYIFKIKFAYDAYYPKVNDPLSVESVVGAAMVISKKNYQQVNGFDNKFFLYFEDLDLCRKIINSGKKIIYVPSVKSRHSIGKSASSNPKSQQLLINSAKIYHGNLNFELINLIIKIGRHL